MRKYNVYATGPDGRSTYPECWGHNNSRGRYVGTAHTLEDARQMAWEDSRDVAIYCNRKYLERWCEGVHMVD